MFAQVLLSPASFIPGDTLVDTRDMTWLVWRDTGRCGVRYVSARLPLSFKCSRQMSNIVIGACVARLNGGVSCRNICLRDCHNLKYTRRKYAGSKHCVLSLQCHYKILMVSNALSYKAMTTWLTTTSRSSGHPRCLTWQGWQPHETTRQLSRAWRATSLPLLVVDHTVISGDKGGGSHMKQHVWRAAAWKRPRHSPHPPRQAVTPGRAGANTRQVARPAFQCHEQDPQYFSPIPRSKCKTTTFLLNLIKLIFHHHDGNQGWIWQF